MFDSALELFSQAASSSLFIFFFCNLIIVMILVGSKSGSEFDQKGHIYLSIVTSSGMNEKQGQGTVPSRSYDGNKTLKESDAAEPTTMAEHSLDFEGSKMLTDAYKDSDALESHADDCDQVNGSDNDYDELERRVEEFILKVNKEWRRESLRTSSFV